MRGDNIKNPWKDILLNDYESHMKLDSVMQLQAMNEMMKEQFYSYPVSSVMILGVAGGNGLEHIKSDKFKSVYGVDINTAYLKEAVNRYPNLNGIFKPLSLDLTSEYKKLPKADLIIANLIVEYIGYECFKNVVSQVSPKYVSCIIQINSEDTWVSTTEYLHVFDDLEKIHTEINEKELIKAMSEIGYNNVKSLEHNLPNNKKLLRLDFKMDEKILLLNINKLHTTKMGVDRIKKNLNLKTDDVVEYIKKKVLDINCVIYKQGKNWYCEDDDIIITINSFSYTIITAHIKK